MILYICICRETYICVFYRSHMKKNLLQLWNKSLRRKISAISWNKRVCRLKTISENLGVLQTCWNLWNMFPFSERWFAQRSSCPLPFLFLPPTMAATHQIGVRKCYRPGWPRLVLAVHDTAKIRQWSCAGDADAPWWQWFTDHYNYNYYVIVTHYHHCSCCWWPDCFDEEDRGSGYENEDVLSKLKPLFQEAPYSCR